MKYDTVIAVRLSSVEDRELVDQINRYEGTSISDRFRNYLRHAAPFSVVEERQ